MADRRKLKLQSFWGIWEGSRICSGRAGTHLMEIRIAFCTHLIIIGWLVFSKYLINELADKMGQKVDHDMFD